MNDAQKKLLKVLQFYMDDTKREKWLKQCDVTQEELDTMKRPVENRFTKNRRWLAMKDAEHA